LKTTLELQAMFESTSPRNLRKFESIEAAIVIAQALLIGIEMICV
jgi:hypothetical protein